MTTFEAKTTIKGYRNIDVYGGKHVRPLTGVYKVLGFDELRIKDETSFLEGEVDIWWWIEVSKYKNAIELTLKVVSVSGTLKFEGIDLDNPYDEDAELVQYEVEFNTDTEKDKFDIKVLTTSELSLNSTIMPESIQIDFESNSIEVTF